MWQWVKLGLDHATESGAEEDARAIREIGGLHAEVITSERYENEGHPVSFNLGGTLHPSVTLDAHGWCHDPTQVS